MQKYFNYVQNTHGDAIQGASVAVTITSSGATATIYSDDGITTTTNPLTTDENGYFGFYAADNIYTLTISGNGITTQTITGIQLETYAEGTWTPSLGGTATYTVQVGTYTKKGSEVTVHCHLTVNTIGTGATGLVSGLPFPVLSYTQAGSVGFFTGSATNYTFVSCYVNSGSSNIGISGIAAAGASMNAPAAFFGNGTDVYLTVVYNA
jgi:hypothetical protein